MTRTSSIECLEWLKVPIRPLLPTVRHRTQRKPRNSRSMIVCFFKLYVVSKRPLMESRLQDYLLRKDIGRVFPNADGREHSRQDLAASRTKGEPC
jgi:hypothetical protein